LTRVRQAMLPTRFRIVPLDVARDVEVLAEIKRRALGLAREDGPRLERFMIRHCARSGFRGFRADIGSGIIGFAYGAPIDMAWEWSRLVERHIDAAEERELWLYHSFAVSELYVDPEYQNNGAGRGLVRRLCASATEDRALLTTPDADRRARSFYRSLGFVDLGHPVHSSLRGYTLMGACLPLGD
jgi:GNAT superfamily N-acetyltransferase